VTKLTVQPLDKLLAWAAERIGIDGFRADAKAIAVLADSGRIQAVVVYDTFSIDRDVGQCCVHIATDNRRSWATRRTLQILFDYPFETLGLDRITAFVGANNRLAQVLAIRLGFQFEGRERGGARSGDLVMFGMLKEECVWLKGKDDA